MVFKRSAKDVLDIVNVCMELGINYSNGGVVFTKSVDEIREIVDVCRRLGIKYQDGGCIFTRDRKHIESVVNLCFEYGINYQKGGTIFERNLESIKKIVDICKMYGVDYRKCSSVFSSKTDDLEGILKICCDNNFECSGAILQRNPKYVQESIDYVRENFGEEFVTKAIVSHKREHLKEVLPYLEESGYLTALLGRSTTILTLSLDEIKEREEVVRREGEEVIVDGSFNITFGHTRKNYLERHADAIAAVRSDLVPKVYKK